MGIKSIDDVDVEKLKEELLSQTVNTEETRDGVSKYNDSGDRIYMKSYDVEQWGGTLSDKTKVKIVTNNGVLEILKLINPETRESFKFLHSEKFDFIDDSNEWIKLKENGDPLYSKIQYGGRVDESTYDPILNKKIKLISTIDGKPHIREMWKYYDNGNLKHYLKEEGNSIEETTNYYDDDNKLIRTIRIDSYGKTEYTYEYDDKGRVIKETESYGGVDNKATVYEYDDEGRITREETTNGGETTKIEETTYEGDITKIFIWTELLDTWIEKEDIRIVLKKQRNKNLKDFEYFRDLIDVEKLPIVTLFDYR